MQEEAPELELRVQVLNINEDFNEELKEFCLTLREYMQYVDKVRRYAEEISVDEAVDRAVDECIRHVIWEKAHEDGMEKGEKNGDLRRLISLICPKMKMNQSLEKIAEDLVEEVSVIEPVYRATEKLALDYEPEAVF